MPFTPEELEAMRLADEEIEREFEESYSAQYADAEISKWLDDLAVNDALDHKQLHNKRRRRAYREAHKDEIADYQRAYYEAHKDEIADYRRAYREAHRDEIADYQRAYYEAHKDEAAAYQRAYRARKKNAAPDTAMSEAARKKIQTK